jgi:hypothetical protein
MTKERVIKKDLYAHILINSQLVRITQMDKLILKKIAGADGPASIGKIAELWFENYDFPTTQIPARIESVNKKVEGQIGTRPIQKLTFVSEGNRKRKYKSYCILEGTEINFGED